MKAKIAVIGLKGLPAFGGAAAVGENLIKELKNDFDFYIYETKSHSNFITGYKEGVYHIVFKKIRNKKLNTLLYYFLSCFHAVFKGNYDILHLHHRDAAFLIPFLRLRYKVILTTHGGFLYNSKWKKYKWFFAFQEYVFVRFANQVICVSKNEVRKYQDKAKTKTMHIPNGVSISEFEINKSSIEEEYITFAAGRIVESKGLHILLHALKLMENPPKLLVIGDIQQSFDYYMKVNNLSRDLKIEFTGLIKDKQRLLSYIKNSKFFVFPSSKEGMSMMLLETASLQVPIICSDTIENKDIFSSEHVLFFETDNVQDLLNKMNLMMSNSLKYELLALNASKYIAENFNWKSISMQYKEIYQNYLN